MPIEFTVRQEIAAPPERVFAVLQDLDSAKQWMPGLVAIERLSPGRFGRGTQWRETRRMFGSDASEVYEVTGFEPGRSLELYVDGEQGSSKRGYFRYRYRLEPAGSTATTLSLTTEIGGMGFLLELLGRFMVGGFKKNLLADLEALAKYVERPGRTP